MASEKIILTFLCLLVGIRAEIDKWQLVNRGGAVTVISTNDKAVYRINTAAALAVMQDDNGFEKLSDQTKDASVNGDYGIWIAKTGGGIQYRQGTSSSNLIGTSWLGIPGIATGAVTGRYGLAFHFNSHGNLYIRTGITSGSHQGSGWKHVYGSQIKKGTCAKHVCFIVAGQASLFASRKFQGIDSPPMSEDWVFTQEDTSDISAYGDNILWRLDGSGGAWQAVNVFDNVFNNIKWERRDYQTSNLKDIAVTDKVQFAVSKDNGLLLLTGCSIFDFEDNDLSQWVQTGTAFAQQPVVSQQTFYNRPSGKVGDRLIDTFSGRKDYSMPENAPEATITDAPTGSLTSPTFQIRTDMLHFVIGGGSPPSNYVGLYIDDSEKFQGAGRSKDHYGHAGARRAARYWWDVTPYKENCAYLKIVDQGTTPFGHTIFDDLRASPPCFKRMNVTLTRFDHDGNVTVGQMITDILSLKGFYTSKTRPLKIVASYPVVNGFPIIYIENINISKTHCQNDVDMTQNKTSSSSSMASSSSMTSSSSRQWHTVTTYLKNYLLSDAEIKITSRVYDHDDLQINSIKPTMIRVSVDYMNEYVAKIQKEVKVTRHGNETANIYVEEGISNQQSYDVGENVTYEVRIGHNYSSSSQRAYNFMIKLFLPPFMTLVHVSGLQNTLGDVLNSPSKSQHEVHIPMLFLGDERTFVFDMRITGEPLWNRKLTQGIQGRFLVDLISYCPFKGCQNAHKNGTDVKILVKGKPYSFQFSSKQPNPAFSYVYEKINDTTKGLLIICGAYDVITEKRRPNCYYGNSTPNSWYSLHYMLKNATFYDAKERVIFGTSISGLKMRLLGERFERSEMLSNEEWNAVVADSGSLMKPKILHGTRDNRMLTEPKGTANGPWNQWQCCGG